MKKNHLIFILVILFTQICSAQSNFVGSGISMKFPNSVGNYLNIGDVYNTLTFPATFEAWVYPTQFPPIWGGIFGSDNDASKYFGCWIRTSSTNTLEIEFGDGFGSGYQYRRGKVTTSSISLNKWTQISIVANSVTDIHIYFNGVDQPIVNTDGASSTTSFTHSSGIASIGSQTNVFGNQYFNGQMDEIRLWNTARTQTEIQDNMCKKLDPNTVGLIGYWVADESYTSTTVNDLTTPSENGNIVGTVTKQTSGAPIGNASSDVYTSNWNGLSINVSDLSGDIFTAKNITGTPNGVQVYRVDSLPHDTIGLDTIPKFYFGVFCAEGPNAAIYDVNYHYNYNDGIINNNNEPTLNIYKRSDGAVTNWASSNATLDISSDELNKTVEGTRAEYILDVKNVLFPAFNVSDNSICEKFCINYTDQSINNPNAWQWTFEGGSPPTSTQQNPLQICYNVAGTYDVTLTTTNANGNATLVIDNYITVFANPGAPTITQSGYELTSSSAYNYQWQLNSADIPGATNQSYTIPQTGSYSVIITDENGCVSSSTVYIQVTGIEEIVLLNASIFPNPATDQLNISFSNLNQKITLVRILDLLGKILFEQKNLNEDLKLDVSNFADGIYFIEAIGDSQKFYSKFEVKK